MHRYRRISASRISKVLDNAKHGIPPLARKSSRALTTAPACCSLSMVGDRIQAASHVRIE
jgi:hypothetical protein